MPTPDERIFLSETALNKLYKAVNALEAAIDDLDESELHEAASEADAAQGLALDAVDTIKRHLRRVVTG